MQPSNANKLKPHKLLNYFESLLSNSLDEVFIRRIISAVYFSLFNYWSMKNICKGNKGKGDNNDSFPHTQFIQDLASSGLDPQIYLSYGQSTQNKRTNKTKYYKRKGNKQVRRKTT